MAKDLVEITGFRELQDKIKKLSNDKDKRKPIIKILRNSAKSTIDIARRLAPVEKGYVVVGGKRYRRKNYTPGTGRRSIKFQVMKRASVPMGIVGPRSTGKYDGWYMRQFVIPGHNIYKGGFKRNRKGNAKANAKGVKSKIEPNFFMNRAKAASQKKVIGKAIPATEKYLQKLINQL